MYRKTVKKVSFQFSVKKLQRQMTFDIIRKVYTAEWISKEGASEKWIK